MGRLPVHAQESPWPASRAVGARAGLSPLVQVLRDTVSYQILGYETFAPGASAAGADAAGQEVRNETGRPTGGRGRIDRSQPLHFTFNGVAYQGYPGDTLASALLANGLRFVARSFISPPARHRRGGVEEPNAVVQLEAGPYSVPNARATEIELYQGLAASSVNAEPSLERDRLAINQRLARFLPAGFYYKTFMWPRAWPRYEARIRAAAGLGSAPDARDAERYDKRYAHCDVLVLGGGPAGLAAADAAAATGARVILVDEQRELGGSLLSCPAEIDGEPALRWAGRIEAACGSGLMSGS